MGFIRYSCIDTFMYSSLLCLLHSDGCVINGSNVSHLLLIVNPHVDHEGRVKQIQEALWYMSTCMYLSARRRYTRKFLVEDMTP